MSFRKIVGLVSAVSLGAVTVYGMGCSSSSGGGTTPVVDSGHILDTGRLVDSTSLVDVNFDTGSMDSGPACVAPATLPGFTPVTIKPLITAACSATQVTNFVNDCLISTTATQTLCTAYTAVAANKPCVQCMVTGYWSGMGAVPAAVSPWGPLVEIGDFDYSNLGGCITAVHPADAPCGQAFNNVLQCEANSCAAQCPFDPMASSSVQQQEQNALDSCNTASLNAACMNLVNAEATACAGVGGIDPDAGADPATSFCFDMTLFSDSAVLSQFILNQCGGAEGGAPGDGGGGDASDGGGPG